MGSSAPFHSGIQWRAASLVPSCRLERPRFQASDFQEFRGAEAFPVNHPPSEKTRCILRDMAGWQHFGVPRERYLPKRCRGVATLAKRLENEGQCDEKIRGRDGIGANEDAGGN